MYSMSRQIVAYTSEIDKFSCSVFFVCLYLCLSFFSSSLFNRFSFLVRLLTFDTFVSSVHLKINCTSVIGYKLRQWLIELLQPMNYISECFQWLIYLQMLQPYRDILERQLFLSSICWLDIDIVQMTRLFIWLDGWKSFDHFIFKGFV